MKIWSAEIDPAYRALLQTLDQNKLTGDISSRDSRTILEIVDCDGIGSPCQPESRSVNLHLVNPCQPFSKVLTKVIQRLNSDAENIPNSICLENVDNIRKGAGTTRWTALMKKLRRRYVMKSRDLNAKGFKTCQNRLRTIAVGLNKRNSSIAMVSISQANQ